MMNERNIIEFIQKNKLKTLDGTDHFSKLFCGSDWSAPFIQQPSILKEYVNIIGLVGAEIKEVAIVGNSIYNLGRINVSSLYPDRQVKAIRKGGRYEYYPWNLEETMKWLAEVKYTDLYISSIDEPVIFLTDRGAFEIDFSESSTVRMSKNCIPSQYYQSDIGSMYSFDVRKLFASLKGDSIKDVSVEEQTFNEADFEFTNSYAIGLEEDMPSYIKTINLHLESERQIIFFSDFDWGGVYILDNDGHQIRIPTKDLNKYLRVPIGTKIKE